MDFIKNIVLFASVAAITLLLSCSQEDHSPAGPGTPSTIAPLSSTNFEDTPPLPDIAEQARSLSGDIAAALSQEALDAIAAGLTAAPTTSTLPKAAANPDTALHYYEMGLEAAVRGSIITARYCFLLAVYFEPDNAEYLCKVGFAYNYINEYETARVFLLKAVALDSQSFDIHANLAKTYKGLGDLNRALYEMNLALSFFPNNPFLLIYQSTLCLALDDRYSAYYSLMQAKAIAPYLSDVDSLLALVGPIDTNETTNPDIVSITPPEYPPAGQMSTANPVFILDTVIAAYQDALNTYAPQIGQVLGIGGESWNIEQDFLSALDDHAYAASQCAATCNMDLKCESDCYGAQCGADQASLGTALSLEGPVPGKGAAIYRNVLNDFLVEAYGVYYRHPNAVDRHFAYQVIVTNTETIQEIIRGLYPDSDEKKALWISDVTATCNAAADVTLQAILEELENMSLLSSNDVDAGICLVIICISLTSDKISIGGNAFFINVNLEIDIGGKDVTFGAGPAAGPFGSARLELSASGTVKVTKTAQMPIGPYASHSTNIAQLW